MLRIVSPRSGGHNHNSPLTFALYGSSALTPTGTRFNLYRRQVNSEGRLNHTRWNGGGWESIGADYYAGARAWPGQFTVAGDWTFLSGVSWGGLPNTGAVLSSFRVVTESGLVLGASDEVHTQNVRDDLYTYGRPVTYAPTDPAAPVPGGQAVVVADPFEPLTVAWDPGGPQKAVRLLRSGPGITWLENNSWNFSTSQWGPEFDVGDRHDPDVRQVAVTDWRADPGSSSPVTFRVMVVYDAPDGATSVTSAYDDPNRLRAIPASSRALVMRDPLPGAYDPDEALRFSAVAQQGDVPDPCYVMRTPTAGGPVEYWADGGGWTTVLALARETSGRGSAGLLRNAFDNVDDWAEDAPTGALYFMGGPRDGGWVETQKHFLAPAPATPEPEPNQVVILTPPGVYDETQPLTIEWNPLGEQVSWRIFRNAYDADNARVGTADEWDDATGQWVTTPGSNDNADTSAVLTGWDVGDPAVRHVFQLAVEYADGSTSTTSLHVTPSRILPTAPDAPMAPAVWTTLPGPHDMERPLPLAWETTEAQGSWLLARSIDGTTDYWDGTAGSWGPLVWNADGTQQVVLPAGWATESGEAHTYTVTVRDVDGLRTAPSSRLDVVATDNNPDQPQTALPPSWQTAPGDHDADAPLVLDWVFADLNTGDFQTGYLLRKREGSATSYWDGAAWQATPPPSGMVATSDTHVVLPAGWGTNNDGVHLYDVATVDSGGAQSEFSAPLGIRPSDGSLIAELLELVTGLLPTVPSTSSLSIGLHVDDTPEQGLPLTFFVSMEAPTGRVAFAGPPVVRVESFDPLSGLPTYTLTVPMSASGAGLYRGVWVPPHEGLFSFAAYGLAALGGSDPAGAASVETVRVRRGPVLNRR